MTTHTFYWTQSELPQAMFYFFIQIALIDNYLQSNKTKAPIWFWLINIALTITVCITHPLTVFPYTFLVFYLLIKHFKKPKSVIFIGLVYLLVFIGKNTVFKSEYDGGAMAGVGNFIHLFPDYFTIQSTKKLVRYFIYDYHFAVLGFVMVSLFYLKQKKYLLLLLVGGYFVGYALLVNVSYPGGAVQFYIENFYTLLAFFVAIPLAFDFLPKLKNQNIAVAMLAIVSIAAIIRIN